MTIVVVGAGICGASTAFELHERGVDVLLLDRGEVSGGTTGVGEGNVLVSDKRPGIELELALAGRALWEELGERFPEVRLRRKGALVLFELEPPAMPPGVEHELLDGAAARVLEPALAPDLAGAVHVPGELQVDPRGLTRGLAAQLGDRVGEHTEVAELRADGVTLATGERIAADAVVDARGAWSDHCTPRKGQLVALGPAPGLVRHKLYEAAYLGALTAGGVAAVIEEALSGEVYVGSSREWAGYDTAVREEVTEAMLARAARFVPALRDLRVTRTWAGLRPARDGGPLVGRTESGVYACTGHEGGGVGLGPISGRRLAERIAADLGRPAAAAAAPPTAAPAAKLGRRS